PRVELRRVERPVRAELVRRADARVLERVERRRRLAREPCAERAEAEDDGTAALHERLARELLLVQEAGHPYAPPFAITAAAFWIAVRIRGQVPQRHR